jgi:hypothetical protein
MVVFLAGWCPLGGDRYEYSASINIWATDHRLLEAERIFDHPIPFEPEWSLSQQVSAFAEYAAMLAIATGVADKSTPLPHPSHPLGLVADGKERRDGNELAAAFYTRYAEGRLLPLLHNDVAGVTDVVDVADESSQVNERDETEAIHHLEESTEMPSSARPQIPGHHRASEPKETRAAYALWPDAPPPELAAATSDGAGGDGGGSVGGGGGGGGWCGSGAASIPGDEREWRPTFAVGAARVVASLAPLPRSVRAVYLEDYVEEMARFFVGPEHVLRFVVHCLAHCTLHNIPGAPNRPAKDPTPSR